MKCADHANPQNQISLQAGELVVKGGASVRYRALAGLLGNEKF